MSLEFKELGSSVQGDGYRLEARIGVEFPPKRYFPLVLCSHPFREVLASYPVITGGCFLEGKETET
jgi:hypothetical protein